MIMEKYNDSNLIITDTIIKTDFDGSEVMGTWETPLMHKTAELINKKQGHILEIGFGLGIFATKCYDLGCESYTIVESHPQIIERALEWAKTRNNVTVIQGDWFDNVEEICFEKYDTIYFDTHLDTNRSKFRERIVDYCLNDGGTFGYFTMGDGDVFGYGQELNVDSINVKSSTESDYLGSTQEMLISYYNKR